MLKVIAYTNNGFPLALHCGITVRGEPKALEVSDYQAECLKGDCRITTLTPEELKARGVAAKVEAEELKELRKDEAKAKAEEAKAKAEKVAESRAKQKALDDELAEQAKIAEKVAEKDRLAKKKRAEAKAKARAKNPE